MSDSGQESREIVPLGPLGRFLKKFSGSGQKPPTSTALTPSVEQSLPVPRTEAVTELTVDVHKMQETGKRLQIAINEEGYQIRDLFAQALGKTELLSLNQIPRDAILPLPDGGYLEPISPKHTQLTETREGRNRLFQGVKRVYPDGTIVYHDLDPFLGFATTQRDGFVTRTYVIASHQGTEQAVQINRSHALSAGAGFDIPDFNPPEVRLTELESGQHLDSPGQPAQLAQEASWEYEEREILTKSGEIVPGAKITLQLTTSGEIADGLFLTHVIDFVDGRRKVHLVSPHTFPLSAALASNEDIRYRSLSSQNRNHEILDLKLNLDSNENRLVTTPPLNITTMEDFLKRAGLPVDKAQQYLQAALLATIPEGDFIQMKLANGQVRHIALRPDAIQEYCELAERLTPLFGNLPQTLEGLKLVTGSPEVKQLKEASHG